MGTATMRELDAAKATIRYIRENDCDFLTVATLQAYGHGEDAAREALRVEMADEWQRQARAGTARLTETFAVELGWDWIPGQAPVRLPDGRLFAVVKGRRWTRVHEYLSNGQLTARWFVDEVSGEAREAESARRPKAWPMATGAQEFARWVVELAGDPTGGV